MKRPDSLKTVRNVALVAWVLGAAAVAYLHFAHPHLLARLIGSAVEISPLLGAALFLLLGALRGLTLVPSTVLVLAGLLFFPPAALFLLLMCGILLSSASVYWFSEFLRLDELLGSRYRAQIAWLTRKLQQYELPVIIAWSAFPFAPTDLVCYVAGTLRINFWKFLLGIAIGETIIVGFYVFAAEHLLKALGM